jgi:hypothetical protein
MITHGFGWSRRRVLEAGSFALLAGFARPCMAIAAVAPQFWRIHKNGTVLTLFGFGDARDQSWFSPALRQAFAESSELWLETAPAPLQKSPNAAQIARWSNLQGRSLFDVLGSDLSARVRQRLTEFEVPESSVAGQNALAGLLRDQWRLLAAPSATVESTACRWRACRFGDRFRKTGLVGVPRLC